MPRTVVAIVKHLESTGNELAGLEIAAPLLEDVFIELTGQEVARLNIALALTINRIQLALRNRLFLVFSLIMPLIFFFLYLGVFARGTQAAMTPLLAEVVVVTVMGNFWGLSVQLVTFREQGILRRFRLAPVAPPPCWSPASLPTMF